MKYIIFVLALIIITLLGYRYYEPTEGEITYIEAEVKTIPGGSFRQPAGKGQYLVRLAEGKTIWVQNWGELPNNYFGPVILKKQKGSITNEYIYSVDSKRTKELHNKSLNKDATKVAPIS